VRIRICGMRVEALVGFYRARLREHPVQELLAGLGIAVGVALVYAVLIANGSITGSADRIVRGITGSASLQVAARSDQGFDEQVATEVADLPGVRSVAPVLRARAALVGPSGRESIEFLGATPELATLGGDLTENLGPGGLRLSGGIALPVNVADVVGAVTGQRVTLLADGRSRRVRVGAVLGGDVLGPIAGIRAALAPLPLAQSLTGRRGRLTQLLIETDRAWRGDVERRVREIADGRVTVTDAQAELQVLREAAKPNDQSTGLFAAISAMVGFLFSLNAMLFTVAERRRFVADLRLEGAAPKQILAVLGFEALALGVAASLAGLALGELLSRALFNDTPDYLSFAFPIGTQRIVEPVTIALAFAGGVAAALVASLRPALDLRAHLPVDAISREATEPGEAIEPRATRMLLFTGVGLVAATTLIVLVAPSLTVLGGLTLALATLLVMPAAFSFVASRLDRATRSTRRLNMLAVALMELRGTTTRSMALAAVAALAVYGSVSIGGARNDLVRGLDSHTREWLSNADIWVTTGGQDLMTNSFRHTPAMRELERTPGIATVRFHRGGFIDVGHRRMWLIGRPREDRVMIPPSQMLRGDLDQATARLRGGGWATASSAFADERDLSIGDRFSIPTPTGNVHYRLAAVTMNLGWIPGAITINDRDYTQAMRTSDPSAIEIDLAPGVTPAEGTRIVERALGPGSGLRVQTRRERELQYYDFGREGVARLSQIAALLLIAAALAVACALAAMVWQRRPRLAALKAQGAGRWQLWRSLLCESGVLVVVGCAVGALLGVYGHLLAGRYLRITTDFAAPFSAGVEQLLTATAVVAGIAILISALPGYLAANAPIRSSFQE
jgi:putative ABC transport system permease protein